MNYLLAYSQYSDKFNLCLFKICHQNVLYLLFIIENFIYFFYNFNFQKFRKFKNQTKINI